MSRYLIQSTVDWQFIHSSPINGDVTWTPSLTTALAYGRIDDLDQVAQIAEDHCDRNYYVVVDLHNMPEGV